MYNRFCDSVIHWYLLPCVLTSLGLNCELYRFSANYYQIDITVYFFQHRNLTSLLEIAHSHLSSSDGSIPMPVLTVLQNPQVNFRVNLINSLTYWTNWLFGKSVLVNTFLVKQSASLLKPYFLASLPTILVLYCHFNRPL